MSSALVSSFASDFEPSQYTDEYQLQLRKLIDERLKTGKTVDTAATFGEEEQQGGDVIDLMDALRRSIEKNKAGSAKAKRGGKAPARAKGARNSLKRGPILSKCRDDICPKIASCAYNWSGCPAQTPPANHDVRGCCSTSPMPGGMVLR